MLMTRKEKNQLQQGKFLFEYDFICLFNFQGRRVSGRNILEFSLRYEGNTH